jgi:hypothetical protein
MAIDLGRVRKEYVHVIDKLDAAAIAKLHRPMADFICFRLFKTRLVVQLRLRLVAFLELDDVDRQTDGDLQMR